MKKLALVVIAAVALFASVSSPVSASGWYNSYRGDYSYRDGYYYKKVVTFKTVIEFEIRKEKFVKHVVRYDVYGEPYKFEKVFFREIKVPVKRIVRVVKWVKVHH
jgi:hypothetical protein